MKCLHLGEKASEELAAKTAHLKEKLVKLDSEMGRLAAMEKLMLASPDQQISLTDPDSRSMATSGRGSGVVGYNVQVAVDTKHHLIVTHEVTNDGSDRAGGTVRFHRFLYPHLCSIILFQHPVRMQSDRIHEQPELQVSPWGHIRRHVL